MKFDWALVPFETVNLFVLWAWIRLCRWRATMWVSVLLCLEQCAAPLWSAQSASAWSQPAPRNSVRAAPNAVGFSRYRQPTSSEISNNRLQAWKWSEQTRQTIAPAMHLVETKNFLIFSAWDASQDRALAKVCDEMNDKLRKQFNIQPTESVWAGKCPIYVFWDPVHFLRFTKEVDRISNSDPKTARSDGYHATRGRFSYIVINGVREFGASIQEATTRFYEVLVHEGTHGFLSRFTSSRPMPLWIEEGLADYMAAILVPGSEASRKHLAGTRYALRKPNAVLQLFDKDEFTSMDYGIAQSFIRYLIATDSRAFVRFVTRMKQGASEETALAECYRSSKDEMVRNWARYGQRQMARDSS